MAIHFGGHEAHRQSSAASVLAALILVPTLVPGTPLDRQPRIPRKPLGLVPGALAQREHGPAGVADHPLVPAGVAQAGLGPALYSIHIPDATRAWTSRGRSRSAIASRIASVSSSANDTSRASIPY